MEALFQMINSIEKHGSVSFPIKSIHGLKVNASIEKRVFDDGDVFYTFCISDSYYLGNEENYDYYGKTYTKIKTDQELKIMLECCVRFVKQCKIDKLTGKFALEGSEKCKYEKNIHDYARLIDLFEDVEHIKTILNKCSVCHDWTATTLKECEHPLCIDCLRHLVVKPCECCYGDDPHANCDCCRGLEEVSTCPLCRRAIVEGIY